MAPVTGIIEYETPVAPHLPLVGPEIFGVTPGKPVAIPLHLCALGVPHGPTDRTHTVDPPGMVDGNNIEHVVPVPVTIAPATEVVHW